MALVIELRSDGKVVGGIEEWWDHVENWIWSLPASSERFPRVKAIESYGFLVVTHDELPALMAELEVVVTEAPRHVVVNATHLLELCRRATELSGSYLNFVGD